MNENSINLEPLFLAIKESIHNNIEPQINHLNLNYSLYEQIYNNIHQLPFVLDINTQNIELKEAVNSGNELNKSLLEKKNLLQEEN